MVNPGINLLSDALYGTPILSGNEVENAGNVGGMGGFNPGSGGQQVDPNLDPELAMALRISLEEDKERQKKIKEEEEVNYFNIYYFLILIQKKNNEEQGKPSPVPTEELPKVEKMNLEENIQEKSDFYFFFKFLLFF